MCPPTPPPRGHNDPSAPCTMPPPHLSTAHARLQLVTGSGQPPHPGAPGDFKRVPGTPAQFLVPHSPTPQTIWALALPQLWLLGLRGPAPALFWLCCSSSLWVSGATPAWPLGLLLSSATFPYNPRVSSSGKVTLYAGQSRVWREAVKVFCEGRRKTRAWRVSLRGCDWTQAGNR